MPEPKLGLTWPISWVPFYKPGQIDLNERELDLTWVEPISPFFFLLLTNQALHLL